MTPEQAKAELLSNPERFLKHYPINIAGANVLHAPRAVNSLTFFLYKRPSSEVAGDKTGHWGATRPGNIVSGHTHQISSWKITTVPAPAGTPFETIQASSIPMLVYDASAALPMDVTQLDSYWLDASSTDGIMVTGQLSGCCFCWLDRWPGLWCTHIKPTGRISGEALHEKLRTHGRFAPEHLQWLETFGRADYLGAVATVIGVRRLGSWKLFAQTSTDGHQTITAAYRLFPGPKMRL